MQIRADPMKAASKVASNPNCKHFFEKDKILFPVHVGSRGQAHWLALVLDVKRGVLKEFNSLNSHLREEIETMKTKVDLRKRILRRKRNLLRSVLGATVILKEAAWRHQTMNYFVSIAKDD